MKIEIGESLMLSYLKHVKKCVFYQTNWKNSSNWETFNDEKVQSIFDLINTNQVFDVFKNNKLSQLLKQSEIDVIGMDCGNTVYAIDIAFHEAGLNYGSKDETKNRVLKKLLRSYLSLLSYYPDKNYELIFVSPKVHNATEEVILSYFSELEKTFSSENVKFRYISNELFKNEIVIPTIKFASDDSDTNELFLRSAKLFSLFDLYTAPNKKSNSVEIQYENTKIDTNNSIEGDFTIELNPNDDSLFKQKLLITKKANRSWFYHDGRIVKDIWDASNLTVESNLRSNIGSSNKVRTRKETGLFKLRIEIAE